MRRGKSWSRARPSSLIQSATAFRSCCRKKRGRSIRDIAMRKGRLIVAIALLAFCRTNTDASAGEASIRVGNLDAVLTTPADVERPPVVLLIAGSGSTDRDGNGPQAKPATLKKLAEQLAERKVASLRYDKRGAGGWKAEFGKPEDFRFKDYVDDAVSLVNYLRDSGKFSRVRRRRTLGRRAGGDPRCATGAGRSRGAAGHGGAAPGRSIEGAARAETNSA